MLPITTVGRSLCLASRDNFEGHPHSSEESPCTVSECVRRAWFLEKIEGFYKM